MNLRLADTDSEHLMSSMRKLKALALMLTLSVLTSIDIGAYDELREAGGVYYSAVCDEMTVALTFDDGPHKYRTDEILDVLKKYDVKATFFTVGKMAREYPNVIRREIAEGHEIGNHTNTHAKMSKMTQKSLRAELEATEEVLFEIAEYRPKLFRPPEGWCSESIAAIAGEMDYNVILWNIDTLDWAHNEPDKICKCVFDGIRPGSIILFHDYVSGKSPTVEALETIIPELKLRGYRFVTVSELINIGYGSS